VSAIEPIEPRRVEPASAPAPLVRRRREGEEDPGGRRHPQDGRDERRGEEEADDGLPHVDVRA
jgi:hypothetical protein